jgi:hypothetical protein
MIEIIIGDVACMKEEAMGVVEMMVINSFYESPVFLVCILIIMNVYNAIRVKPWTLLFTLVES